MNTILIIVLILILVGAFGALPTWPHSANWGYGPSGGLAVILIVLVVLLIMGKL